MRGCAALTLKPFRSLLEPEGYKKFISALNNKQHLLYQQLRTGPGPRFGSASVAWHNWCRGCQSGGSRPPIAHPILLYCCVNAVRVKCKSHHCMLPPLQTSPTGPLTFLTTLSHRHSREMFCVCWLHFTFIRGVLVCKMGDARSRFGSGTALRVRVYV